MMSLFSMFDLYTNYMPTLMYILLSIFMLNLFYKMNMTNFYLNKVKNFLENFMISMKPKNFNKIIKIMFFSLFTTIFLMNFISIFSYNFSLTSQISFVMFLAASLWLSMVTFTVLKSTKNFLAHCIPEGTPMGLVWFLFMIELISNLIRPLTVTVRLVANIMAGHLLMSLLAKLVMSMESISIMYMMLNLVEMFVSLIQAYIFMTMMVLYYSEIA